MKEISQADKGREVMVSMMRANRILGRERTLPDLAGLVVDISLKLPEGERNRKARILNKIMGVDDEGENDEAVENKDNGSTKNEKKLPGEHNHFTLMVAEILALADEDIVDLKRKLEKRKKSL